MPKRKNWVELLTTKAREDKATNLTINNINLIDCVTVLRSMRCDFVCHCGGKGNKDIRSCIEKSGMFCKECSMKSGRIKQIKTCLEKYGVECSLQSQLVRDKQIKTCLERYGVENPLQSQEIRDKIKATNIEKYGVENASQSQIAKDKIKETNLEKYGVEHISQSQQFKDKFKATCLEKYGVEYSLQSQIVKDKGKATCLEKYGVENPQQSQIIRDKTKETNLERYGVEYCSQNTEIFEKMMKTRFKRKPYTFKSGETIECQGYEPWTLKDLEQNYNYTYEDYMNEPKEEFWYDTNDGKKHRYHNGGDIPFLKENKLIEVKSDYTFYADFYVNLLKSQCVLEKGYDFEFWVYDNKKELSIIDYKFMTNKFIVNSELLEHFKSSRV